jgi:hypothetical protein
MFVKPLRFAFLIVAMASVLATSSASLAQETEFPIVPDPAECQVIEPRSGESLAAIAGTPSPEMTAATEADLPQGEAADEETTAAIIEAERLLVACYNAGDFSRLLTLLTDHAILMAVGGTPDQSTIDILLSPATPSPTDSMISLVAVRDVRVLEDGRVGAIADWGVSSDPTVITEINFEVFVKVGDVWLLDDEITGLPVPAATPAA